MKKTLLIIAALLPAWLNAMAQDVATVQPKIMVIPYTQEGEDLRTVLEDDANKRIVLTKIKESFDNRGFSTVDFTAKVKAVSQNAAFTADNQSDLKSMLIESSGADIYVEAEILVNLSSTGNSVRIILTGYDTSTGTSLSNKVGESGKFYTDDIYNRQNEKSWKCKTKSESERDFNTIQKVKKGWENHVVKA